MRLFLYCSSFVTVEHLSQMVLKRKIFPLILKNAAAAVNLGGLRKTTTLQAYSGPGCQKKSYTNLKIK
jgi:hypothetical protein